MHWESDELDEQNNVIKSSHSSSTEKKKKYYGLTNAPGKQVHIARIGFFFLCVVQINFFIVTFNGPSNASSSKTSVSTFNIG